MNYVFLVTISYFDVLNIETLFLKHNLDFKIKDLYQSSLAGGWVTPGSNFNEKSVFINVDQLKKAQLLLDKYVNND
tara:strand:+ start:603 stop:830 length:228 start_codon:yes stop_codon:yes gene_type:complete